MEALERNLFLKEATRPCNIFPVSNTKSGPRQHLSGQFVDDNLIYTVYYRVLFQFFPIQMTIICFPRFGKQTGEHFRSINVIDFTLVYGIFTLMRLILSSFFINDKDRVLSELTD